MAKATVMFDENFGVSLEKIGQNINGICEKAVEAGGKVAVDIVKSNLKSALGHDKKKDRKPTGELLSSLGVSKPDTDKKGIINVKVGFSEPRRHQPTAKKKRSYYTVTNAMIANVIEHGKHGQPARPFMARSRRQAETPCREAMRKTVDKELERYK